MFARVFSHLQNVEFSFFHRLADACQPGNFRVLAIKVFEEALHRDVVVVNEVRWGNTVEVVTRTSYML